jgi:hypothetical protein
MVGRSVFCVWRFSLLAFFRGAHSLCKSINPAWVNQSAFGIPGERLKVYDSARVDQSKVSTGFIGLIIKPSRVPEDAQDMSNGRQHETTFTCRQIRVVVIQIRSNHKSKFESFVSAVFVIASLE